MNKKFRMKLQNIKRRSNNNVSNNDYNVFFGTLQRLGTNAIIEGKVSKKCRYVNRQINSKVGMIKF